MSMHKRSSIVGLAIAQAMALLKEGDAKAALDAVTSVAKRLSKPNADLLLAIGRFSLNLDPPDRDHASKIFAEAYLLGQRKQLLFDLWFDAEYGRGSLESALEVKTKAIDHEVGDARHWYERSAQVHIAIAQRSTTRASADSAIREVDSAISDLRTAKELCSGEIQRRQMQTLLDQAQKMKLRLTSGHLHRATSRS
jgi:lysyl-tRNA synthetase class I